MPHLKILLYAAGILHFAILIASALTPRALNWRENLAALHPFLRQLFWVYGVFIVLVIVSFRDPDTFASRGDGKRRARGQSLSAFIAVFWLARLVVQLFVFDARPFLTHWIYRLGYHGLTAVFVYLAVLYGWTALN